MSWKSGGSKNLMKVWRKARNFANYAVFLFENWADFLELPLKGSVRGFPQLPKEMRENLGNFISKSHWSS